MKSCTLFIMLFLGMSLHVANTSELHSSLVTDFVKRQQGKASPAVDAKLKVAADKVGAMVQATAEKMLETGKAQSIKNGLPDSAGIFLVKSFVELLSQASTAIIKTCGLSTVAGPMLNSGDAGVLEYIKCLDDKMSIILSEGTTIQGMMSSAIDAFKKK